MGAKPEVRTHRTALFHWIDRSLQIENVAGLTSITAQLATIGAPSTPVMLRLRLTGHVPLSDLGAITETAQDLGAIVKYLALDLTDLKYHSDADALDSAFTGSLRIIADRLVAAQTDEASGPHNARVAARALQALAQFSRSATP